MDQAEKLRNVIKQKQQNDKPNARVITITSGKGGVGKSNTAVNLAVCLKKRGKRVLIFDADFGLANVEVMFGSVPQYTLSDFLYRDKKIREVITQGPEGIGFISGGTGVLGLSNLNPDQLSQLIYSLRELDDLADIILIDTGAGIAENVLEFVLASPEVLLVTTPDPTSMTDAYSLLKTLYRNPAFMPEQKKIRMLANRVSSASEGQFVYDKLNAVVARFLEGSIDYIGMIPQDSMLEKAVRQQKAVSLYAPLAKSSKAFELLADNLLNYEYRQLQRRTGIADLISQIWKRKS